MSDGSVRTQRIEVGGRATIRIEVAGVRVEVLEGPDTGLVRTFGGPEVRVGKAAGNDLVLTDLTVSGRHAVVVPCAEGFRVRDLDSSNGLEINGVRLREGVGPDPSRLRLGSTLLRLTAHRDVHEAEERDRDGLGELVGSAPAMLELYAQLEAMATSHLPVLIGGETGCGKELVARELHRLSGRPGRLVPYDTATATPEQIPSDLFGHEKGAFTGAVKARPGIFRAAEGGTVFLDEIGELPPALQQNLLRVLENREVSPVGADLPVPVDVRVVAATHRDLRRAVAEGSFREDLYYRLAVLEVRVPPLRERLEDLPLLAAELCRREGLEVDLGDAARERLKGHPWPGNVRELRNVLGRLSVLARGRAVQARDLDFLEAPGPGGAPPRPGRKAREVTPEEIRQALERAGGNRAEAAALLGISESTLYRRLRSMPGED